MAEPTAGGGAEHAGRDVGGPQDRADLIFELPTGGQGQQPGEGGGQLAPGQEGQVARPGQRPDADTDAQVALPDPFTDEGVAAQGEAASAELRALGRRQLLQ